jgi:hypothetical protein
MPATWSQTVRSSPSWASRAARHRAAVRDRRTARRTPADPRRAVVHHRQHARRPVEARAQELEQLLRQHRHRVAVRTRGGAPRSSSSLGLSTRSWISSDATSLTMRWRFVLSALPEAARHSPVRRPRLLAEQAGAQAVVEVVAQVGDAVAEVDEVGLERHRPASAAGRRSAESRRECGPSAGCGARPASG